jgi:hypothetical protein
MLGLFTSSNVLKTIRLRSKHQLSKPTRPTTDLLTPTFCSLAIILGSTDSEDEVSETMNNSSPMYLTNCQMLNPCRRATSLRAPIS